MGLVKPPIEGGSSRFAMATKGVAVAHVQHRFAQGLLVSRFEDLSIHAINERSGQLEGELLA